MNNKYKIFFFKVTELIGCLSNFHIYIYIEREIASLKGILKAHKILKELIDNIENKLYKFN